MRRYIRIGMWITCWAALCLTPVGIYVALEWLTEIWRYGLPFSILFAVWSVWYAKKGDYLKPWSEISKRDDTPDGD